MTNPKYYLLRREEERLVFLKQKISSTESRTIRVERVVSTYGKVVAKILPEEFESKSFYSLAPLLVPGIFFIQRIMGGKKLGPNWIIMMLEVSVKGNHREISVFDRGADKKSWRKIRTDVC